MARDFPANAANYLSVGDVSALDITGTALTIACWAKLDAVSGAGYGVVGKYGFAGHTQYLLYVSGSKLRFVISDNSSDDNFAGATNIATATWQHLGGVKNGTGAGAHKIFLNGAVDATNTSNKSLANTDASVILGQYQSANPLDGSLAEVAIWDVALSDAEMAALAKGVCPLRIRRDHLKGYWPLMGVAAPEADLSGNGNNMAQTGTVTAVVNHAPVGRLLNQPG